MVKGFGRTKGLTFKRPRPPLGPSIVMAALGGVLQTLSWPRPGLWPLCFICLVPLIVAARGAGGRRGFFLGWVYGLALGLSSLGWLAEVMGGYGGLGPFLGWAILVLLCAFLALFQGLFAFIITMPRLGLGGLSLVGAASFCGLDWLKNWILTGFNWTPLAGPLALSPLGQGADLIGFYGLGFAAALINFFIASAWLARREKSGRAGPYLAAAALLAAALFTYGRVQYEKWEAISLASPAGTVAVVQPSTPQDYKWNAAFRDDLFARYARLNQLADGFSPWFILWPETAMPFVLDYDYEETQWLRDLSAASQSPILAGIAAVDGVWPDESLRNRMILLKGGEIVSWYDKRHLVPFGEYVPLDELPFLRWAFVQGLIGAAGDYGPGREFPPIELQAPGSSAAPVRLGILICFESTFPYIGRQRALEGAQILIVPTNDGWFGRSRAPEQHLWQASMRAVETRRPLVRAGNTGISALIHPSGRIAEASALYDVGAYPFKTPILTEEHLIDTVFVRGGWLLAPIMAVITGLLSLIRLLRKD